MSPTVPTMDASPAPADPQPRIDALREQIDRCDTEIIELVRRRLAASREVGALRTASGGTRLALSRESQVLDRFRRSLGEDGTALALLLLRQGRGRL